MSRLEKAFGQGKALIPFITCGDPSLDVSAAVVRALEKAGADALLLGIPFSDPTAEGPVVQSANVRALAAGCTTDRIFDFAAALRADVKLPLVLVTYANVVFSYGIARFMERAAAAGVDGLIIPDVPFEEREEFAPLCREKGMDFIPMATARSGARCGMIAAEAEGFVYCLAGTDAAEADREAAADMLARVREKTALPAFVDDPALADLADGLIVPEAFVEKIAAAGDAAPEQAAALAKALKENLK